MDKIITSDTFTAEDIKFLAEYELITIEPFFRADTFSLSGIEYGPFTPPIKTNVPIWVALTLKSQKLCKIISPSWLTVENLTILLDSETRETKFSAVPFYYAEISRMLLQSAEDDLKSPGELRMLLQQLKEKRENKIRIGLANLEPIPHKINNISAREIHIMRPTFVMVFDSLRRIQETTLKKSSGQNLSETTRRTVDIMSSQNIDDLMDIEGEIADYGEFMTYD
ncbi:Psf2-domain-containing protein [Gigaspora margarita]|uniref:DNA replication complex GINS protein PSF2 n=1 Tax=Gigaspora margarita TaxID=4874 RepID=A0A8H3X999_GIGMA|nr:Psf2-domain-containing protein [Gigaspora margarita]